MAIAERRMTLDEFLALDEEKPALEYLDGVVTQKVSPKAWHSGPQSELLERFNRFGRPRKLARAFTELRVTFAGNSPVPDIALYLWDRIPTDADGYLLQDSAEPPDLIVEIRSEGQSARSQVDRCLWYVDRGVRVAVFVDPFDHSVQVFRPGRRSGPLRGPDRIALDDLLPGFQLTVAELFESLKAR